MVHPLDNKRLRRRETEVRETLSMLGTGKINLHTKKVEEKRLH